MQDYLYMLQASGAIGGLLGVFLVFRYQTIDINADNRKEALRVLCDISSHPERAEWIQEIGRHDIGKITHDQELIALGIPSVETFVKEIWDLRK